MAWLHDFRDSVQEILEWVSQEVPCTCTGRLDHLKGGYERCMAHRAHLALGALYRHGVPSRRFQRPMAPRYVPAHTVLVAHDWITRDLGHVGAREQLHNPAGCRIWCQDCGAIAPGGCHGATRLVKRGDVLYWWGDYGWTYDVTAGQETKPCRALIGRLFELRPTPPPDLPEHSLPPYYDWNGTWDLTEDVGTRVPPLPRRVVFGFGTDVEDSAREDGGVPPGQHRRSG